MPNKLGPVFSPKYHEERMGKRRRRGRRGEEKDTKTNTGYYFRLQPIPILVTLSESCMKALQGLIDCSDTHS